MANCNASFIGSEAYLDIWYSPRLASLYAVMGIVFPILYIPCIIVMTDRDLWSNSCYKIMFFAGIMDICVLSINAVGPAIFMFIPLGFDCYWLANQLLACWTCQLFWNGCCFVMMTLILNRCVFLASPAKWHEILFGRGRVWIWMAAALVYGSVFVAVYASPYGTIIFDPSIGIYVWPTTDVIGLKFATFNNTATAFVIPIGYVILGLIIRKKRSQASIDNANTTSAEKRLQLQAILICTPTCIASLFYYLAPQLTGEVVVYQFLQVIWIISSGCNALVYLLLNKTIRNKVLRLIGMKKFVNGQMSARVMPMSITPLGKSSILSNNQLKTMEKI